MKLLKSILKIMRRIDYRLFWLVNGRLHVPAVDVPVRIVNRIDTFLGDAGKILIILLLAALGAWYCQGFQCRPYFLTVAVIILVNVVIEFIVKRLARQRRPLFVFGGRVRILSERRYGFSLPSGHTQIAFCLATLLSALDPVYTWLFYSLASLVGIYRIYVGAHFPSDVIAGALLGVGVTSLLLRFLPFPR